MHRNKFSLIPQAGGGVVPAAALGPRGPGGHVSWVETGSPRSPVAGTPRSRSNTSHSLDTDSLFPGWRSMADLMAASPGHSISGAAGGPPAATSDGTATGGGGTCSTGGGGNPFRNALHLAILHDSTNTLRALLRFGLDPNRCGEAPPPRLGLEQPQSSSLLASPIEAAAAPEATRQAKSRKGSAVRKTSASTNNELTPYWKNDVSPISADLSSAVSIGPDLQADFMGVQPRKSSSASRKVSTAALVGSLTASSGGAGGGADALPAAGASPSGGWQEAGAGNAARKSSTRLSPFSYDLSSPSASGTGTSSGERETSSAAHQAALLCTPMSSSGVQGPESAACISPNEQSTYSLPSQKLSPGLLSPFSVHSASSAAAGNMGFGSSAASAGTGSGNGSSVRKISGSTSALLLSLLSPSSSGVTNRSPSVSGGEPKAATGAAIGGERRKVSTGTLQPILKPPAQTQGAGALMSDSAAAAGGMAAGRQVEPTGKPSIACSKAGGSTGVSSPSSGPGTGTVPTSSSGSGTPGTARKFHLNLQPQYLPYPSAQSQGLPRKNSAFAPAAGGPALKSVLSSASLKSGPSTSDSAPSAVSCGSGSLGIGLTAGSQAHHPPLILLQQTVLQTLQTIAHYSLCQLFSQPPIFLAVHLNRVEALRLLLRYRAAHRVADACGLTPLHLSAAKQRVGLECSQALIEAGARVYIFSIARVRPVDLFAQLRSEQELLVAKMANAACNGQPSNSSSDGHTNSTSKTAHSSSVATTGTGTGTDTADGVSASVSTSGSQRRRKSRSASRGRGMSLQIDRSKSQKAHKSKNSKNNTSKSPASKRSLHDLTTLKNAKSLMRLTGSGGKTQRAERASSSKEEKKRERASRKLSAGSTSIAMPRPSLGASAGTLHTVQSAFAIYAFLCFPKRCLSVLRLE